MADRMRGDFVTIAIERTGVFDALAHILCRPAKIDPRRAAPRSRALIAAAPGIGDEIAGADEEGEVNAGRVAIEVGGEFRQFLPAFKLAAIVERHDHEL